MSAERTKAYEGKLRHPVLREIDKNRSETTDGIGEKIRALFQPDIIGSYDYWDSLKQYEPEMYLWLAVLSSAAEAFLSGPGLTRRSKRFYYDAKEWLFDDFGHCKIPSYEGVCDVLSVDPSRFRSLLLKEAQNGRPGKPCLY